MKAEPVRILLNGLAAVVNLVLIALVATGALSWDAGQIVAVVAAVQGATALVSEVVRSQVSPA